VALLDPDLEDAESVVLWVSGDAVFDEAPTLQYLTRRIARRLTTNGPAEGMNAGVAETRSKKRSCLNDSTLDDLVVARKNVPSRLPLPTARRVLSELLKKPRNFRQKGYEKKTGNNNKLEQAQGKRKEKEKEKEKEKVKEREKEEVYYYSDEEEKNDETWEKEREERERAITRTPEFSTTRRTKEGWKKNADLVQSGKQVRSKGGSNDKEKRKREKKFEDQEEDPKDKYVVFPITDINKLSSSSQGRPHRQKKLAGLFV
jgi:hypothetical protein